MQDQADAEARYSDSPASGSARGDAGYLPPPRPVAPKQGRTRGLLCQLGILVCWIVVGASFAIVVNIAATPGWRAEGWPALSLPWLLVGFFLSFWPQVVVHEAGHALAGWAIGMRPIACGAGRWRWERGVAGWRLRRAEAIKGIGGFALLLPRSERSLSRLGRATHLLGGPLANLFVAAAGLTALRHTAGMPVVASLLAGVAASGLLLGTVNLLPLRSGGWHLDGRQVLGLLRHTPESRIQDRFARLSALALQVRPRDWPDALVEGDASLPYSPMLATRAGLFRLAWAVDRDDGVSARSCARALVARLHEVPAAMQTHIALALAGFAAKILHDPEVLAAWRPLCDGASVLDLSPYTACLDAESLVLAGDHAGAARAIAHARQALQWMVGPVDVALANERLEQLEAKVCSPYVKDA